MQNFNSSGISRKLAVLDRGALVNAEFLAHTLRFKIEKFLITRDGKTVASVVKRSDIKRLDRFAADKAVVLPSALGLCEVPHLPIASLVRMATEGEVALGLETKSDGSEYLLLTASTERFDPDSEHVVVTKGENQMRIGYQLYLASLTADQKGLDGQILDFEGFKRKEMERMSE